MMCQLRLRITFPIGYSCVSLKRSVLSIVIVVGLLASVTFVFSRPLPRNLSVSMSAALSIFASRLNGQMRMAKKWIGKGLRMKSVDGYYYRVHAGDINR